MGVVYKAEDTRLKRAVALKFLSKEVTGVGVDAERFLREAQAAASLDHPNICTVYEIDEQDGETFLAMAYLEGESLDRRIQRGPLPLDLAYEIARQAAEGLAAAHAAGVVHRDIKPSNIMLGQDGSGRPVVKLMDFGLAKISGASKLTRADARMGTVAYMSPEQSLGEDVGPRSDLWSLGVVTYEMVAGDPPFRGHYDQAVLYSILNEAPAPLTSLRSRVPMELEWIIEKCLAKSPADRYREAGELVADLELLQRRSASGRTSVQLIDGEGEEADRPSVPSGGSLSASARKPETPAPAATARGPVAPRRWMVRLGLAFAVGLAFVAGLAVPTGGGARPGQLRRFTLRPIEAGMSDRRIGSLAISPNGRFIAFSTTGSGGSLWLQPLDRLELLRVDGTDGAREVFWSPDSRFVGFVTGQGIGRVSVEGLVATMLVEDSGIGHVSAAWTPDGKSIVFSRVGAPLMSVSALGGIPKPVFEGSQRRRSSVTSLALVGASDGEQVLLYSERTVDGDFVMARRLASEAAGDAVRVVEGTDPVYSESGHIVYQPSALTPALSALPFSPDGLEPLGEPFVIARDATEPSVSRDGTLVYIDTPETLQMRLSWFDRRGGRLGAAGRPQPRILGPRVSPSGDRVIVAGVSGSAVELWLHESSREVIRRRTFDDRVEPGAVWSPDGRQVAFSHRGTPGVAVVDVDENSPARSLYPGPGGAVKPLDWSRDGRYILVQMRRRSGDRSSSDSAGSGPGRRVVPGASPRIAYLERVGEDWEMGDFLPEGPFTVDNAAFSPNGRYVAYESNESGEFNIYVRPFPAGDRHWQVSTEGGRLARWGSDGRALYFVRDDTLFAVPVGTQEGFRMEDPLRLFSHERLSGPRRFATYDVGPGDRFVIAEWVSGPSHPGIRIVLNWLSEFAAP